MSFVRPRELVSFHQQHVTRSPPIGNVFELEGITMLLMILSMDSCDSTSKQDNLSHILH